MVEKEKVEFAREESGVFGEERGALGRYEKRKRRKKGGLPFEQRSETTCLLLSVRRKTRQ